MDYWKCNVNMTGNIIIEKMVLYSSTKHQKNTQITSTKSYLSFYRNAVSICVPGKYDNSPLST